MARGVSASAPWCWTARISTLCLPMHKYRSSRLDTAIVQTQ
nr:MAG TPA: hypothetical protein [Caudoviricetes sp.]